MDQSVIFRRIAVAAGVFAPGHLGELTRIVSFDLVDTALESVCGTQRRLRVLPSRVVVYLLLAGALFADIGYEQVWARMVAGLAGMPVAFPGSSALAQARRRVGPAPLKALFQLIAGPAAGAARWRGLLVCAVDGTTMFVPDTPANIAAYGRHGGGHAMAGYPMLRLLAVVACGSRTVIDTVFGTTSRGETTYAPTLSGCLRAGMLLLADRNFAVAALIEQITATGADLLIRCKNNRPLPVIRSLPDGSWISRAGDTPVRVIAADIVVTCVNGPARTERYRLITSLLDPDRFPAADLVELYHQRWEIETSYMEMKSGLLGGRVLRARTPAGVEQEVYALLTVYQTLRIAMADTVAGTDMSCGSASFTIALHTARDQVVQAAGVFADDPGDLTGRIGRALRARPLPPRRARTSPRVVKRAISKHRAKGDIDRRSYRMSINVEVVSG